MRTLAIAAILLIATLCIASVAHADRWEVSPLQAVAPATVTGGALSYQVAELGAYHCWATVGLVRDSHAAPDAAYGLLLGIDTDAPLPGLSQLLGGNARAGIAYSVQSRDTLIYARRSVFSW